jgi:DNA-binding protein HU-beta
VNKLGLIQEVSRVVPTQTDAKAAVTRMFEAMLRALQAGEKVVVQGFGSFHVVMRKSKPARNPRTGEEVRIPPRRRVRFKMGKELAGSLAALRVDTPPEKR